MKNIAEVCDFIQKHIRHQPIIVETGCTYTSTPDTLIHITTPNLARIARALDGALYSIDKDPDHIRYSQTLLEGYEYNPVIFMCGNSVEVLTQAKRTIAPIDILCLDSVNDADHMMNEFFAIEDRLAPNHYILVDDIHNPNAVKWKKLVPYLKENGYRGIEIPTPTGLFLATKGYPLE